MGIGHLQGLGDELDHLGDSTLAKVFVKTEFFKTLDEIIGECDNAKVQETIIGLKEKLENSNFVEYWQIIRDFSDDMPCDCGECESV